MFDLEQSTAEWRQQMLAAGIKSPVPLEELEFHLREEIERQINSGSNEAEAFKAAVQTIGQGHALQDEFIKVEREFKTRRTILLIFRATVLISGWLAAACALAYVMMGLEFRWNLFNFHAKWDFKTLDTMVAILAIEIWFWYLAKASHDRATRVVSLIVCLFLAASAMSGLPPEEIKPPDIHRTDSFFAILIKNALNRKAPSPLWYRGALTLLGVMPGIFWLWWERRHVIRERLSATHGKAVHSG